MTREELEKLTKEELIYRCINQQFCFGYDMNIEKGRRVSALSHVVALLNDATDAIEMREYDYAERRIKKAIQYSNSQIEETLP